MVKKKPLRLFTKKKEKRVIETVGHIAFFGGIILAIVVGLVTGILQIVYKDAFIGTPKAALGALALLGFIVGLVNITTKEEVPFLVAASALMLTGVRIGYLIPIPYVGTMLDNAVVHIIAFVIPAAIIVALKAVWMLGKDR